MQYTKFLFVLLLGMLVMACNKSPTVVGEVQTLSGELINLADYRGKWIVVNYWASWCEPCAKEIPQLNAFYKAHAKRDAIVLGVSYDHLAPAELQKLVGKLGIEYPILTLDPKQLLGIEHIPGLPATYLISPQGKLVTSLYGEQTQLSLEEAADLKIKDD